MAFQISIGDVLMLSKLAFDIAAAFTSGRKSAPAEFQEVQNQLYSLSKALDSFKSVPSKDTDDDNSHPEDGISAIIQNCRFTLEHLQLLVDKYMVISNDNDKSKPHIKQWSTEVSKNWKKVRWTREGGDLAKLQHNLGVHINSLNLAVTVSNSELNQTIDRKVDDVHEKLDEIHSWFTSNLKFRTNSFNDAPAPSRSQSFMSSELIFSLHIEGSDYHDIASLCENACFDEKWLQNSTDQCVFNCRCSLTQAVRGGRKHEYLSQYTLSPMSLIVRLNGPLQSWKIWLSSSRTSRLTSLIIRDVPQSHLAFFENAIADLATTTAQQATARGLGSLMVFPSVNPYTDRTIISVLNMMGDTRMLYNKISNLRLNANGHSYLPGSIEMVQMVHYRNLNESGEWLFGETADVMLYLRADQSDMNSSDDHVVKLGLKIDYQTNITPGENTSVVRINQTDCLSTTGTGQEAMVRGIDVDMELCDDAAASQLLHQLKYLQEGLMLFKIQQIQRYEKLVFELPLGLLMVYNYHLADATLKLGLNIETKKYRLLISDRSRSVCLSIEMPLDCLSQGMGSDEPYISIKAPCWIAETDKSFTHIHKPQNEPTLACVDQDAQQLLSLILDSVTRGDHRINFSILERGDGDSTASEADCSI